MLPEGVSSDEYLKLTETAPKGFDPAQYGAKANDSLEGFLFPATYDLGPNGGSQELVNQQLQAFEDNIARVDMSYAKKKNLTVYDVLIIASMIDKEVQVPEERDDVAAVIYNRLSQGDPARDRRDHPLRDPELHRADHQRDPPEGHAVQHPPQRRA